MTAWFVAATPFTATLAVDDGNITVPDRVVAGGATTAETLPLPPPQAVKTRQLNLANIFDLMEFTPS